MNYIVKQFNDDGIAIFQQFLRRAKFDSDNSDFPRDMLFEPRFTESLDEEYYISDVTFQSKHDAGRYFEEVFELSSNKALYYNQKLWSWLSAFYFDQICPVDGGGKRKVGQEARYILQTPKDYQTYYRHLLSGPSRIYSELNEKGRIFLTGELSKRGDLIEQLQAYQNIAMNKGIIEAADALYWDEEGNKLKKGAGSKGPGTPRRFVSVIGQFEFTYDLNSMQGENILTLFPNEFRRWIA
ncbi:hypothetical protein PQ469_00105 [Mucilaginibacter sp. KACC 22773]|uniref:hypothetical protein n=1 Tax=Mucilaginibacter sp. KACC 22773 TaxID=3025671 RepID=UPI002366B8B5|nr:hypothetical protein [Mucilaginibacter sp. KACC 22773]WDF78407.1 hypothetical protein PQ469_00105 [Mucilaginibacter sp. KACC 22773]